jgi:hypothetical protein
MPGPKPAASWIQVQVAVPRGMVEGIAVSSTGLVRVEGWAAAQPPPLRLVVNGREIEQLQAYRVRRPDAARALGVTEPYVGFAIEFLAPAPDISTLSLRLGDRELVAASPALRIEVPHYDHLFAHAQVLHREDIYGAGPPSPQADPIVLEISLALPGPILDFGCGSGALVRALRQQGRNTHGLELHRPAIVESLQDDIRPHVTLYDGSFPSPLGPFDSIICSEVLEHIPDWRGALGEIARLCRRAAVFTVPDMSAIPAAFPHHVVPWHLLEATHLNFFTQRSLAAALGTVFQRVSFARIGDFEINGTRLSTSLVASCER